MENAMSETIDTAASDDWAAALAEQASTENAAPVKRAPAAAFEQFSPGPARTGANDIDLILDIPVQLTVELGRTKIAIKNLLQLAQGSVVGRGGWGGEPMDVFVNGCLIAQGEVVVEND